MNMTMPKTLQKQVKQHAQKYGLSESAYVRTVLKQAIAAENDLTAEMELWEQASLHDFSTFAKKNNI